MRLWKCTNPIRQLCNSTVTDLLGSLNISCDVHIKYSFSVNVSYIHSLYSSHSGLTTQFFGVTIIPGLMLPDIKMIPKTHGIYRLIINGFVVMIKLHKEGCIKLMKHFISHLK